MNTKIFDLGIESRLLEPDASELNYFHSISKNAEIDDVVEYAHLIISECIKVLDKHTHGFDISDRGVAIKQAKTALFNHFYGTKQ
jgi:hypothetical protein